MAVPLYGPTGKILPRTHKRFAAGKNFNSTEGWNPVKQDLNDLISRYGGIVAQRLKHLIRNFPYLKRAKKKHIDLSVTNGFNLQAQVKFSNGKPNKKINDKIEEAFKRFVEQKDLSNKLNLHEMIRLCAGYDFEDGEFLIMKHYRKNKKFLPLELQIIDPSRLENYTDLIETNKSIKNGIEYDEFTGESLFYHFSNKKKFGETIKISAELIIHGFEIHEAGQLRGISPIVCCILIAHDIRNRMDTELELSNMAAKWLAFVEKHNIDEIEENLGLEVDSNTGERIEKIQNGTIEYLEKGESIKINNADRPGAGFEPFVMMIIRMLAVSSNLSYEMISGDYRGINYSNLRGIRLDVKDDFDPIQKRYINHFYKPIYRAFLDSAVMSGKLDLPGYFNNPYKYLDASWLPTGSRESIDALRESKARETEYGNNTRAPQDDIIARGKDPEEVIKKISEWNALLKQYGITNEEVSTALNNNPAKLGASDGDSK